MASNQTLAVDLLLPQCRIRMNVYPPVFAFQNTQRSGHVSLDPAAAVESWAPKKRLTMMLLRFAARPKERRRPPPAASVIVRR